jgi:3-oxoacyl-(acyl-carrier-protein) reductase
MCAVAVLETAAPKDEAVRATTSAKVLAGKRALVTGGSRGIGKAIALALAEAGAAVAINYQRSVEAADEVCRAVCKLGVQGNIFQADVSREEEAKVMLEAVSKEFGEIDILVNNAGITRDKSFLKMTKLMWDEVLGVNLNGVFYVTRLVLPAMVEAGWGRVINMTSIVGQTGNFGQANYAVTKGGLIAFTMTLAREVARKGVTVNAIAPGFIETDMTKDMTAAALSAVTAMTPLGRLGKPEEVAAAALFLASPQASYITGQVIPVNGGMYM